MSHSIPRFLVPALALLAAIATGDALALPHVAHHDAVKHCHSLGNVHASSGYGKHHDWKSLAKHRALVKAEKLGATHVVWHRIHSTGSFNGTVDGKAYACHGHHHHHHHSGQ
ncbi:MAG: hypothetical protein ACKN9T_18685 [Candidatus Methylumidiphilus sp.]